MSKTIEEKDVQKLQDWNQMLATLKDPKAHANEKLFAVQNNNGSGMVLAEKSERFTDNYGHFGALLVNPDPNAKDRFYLVHKWNDGSNKVSLKRASLDEAMDFVRPDELSQETYRPTLHLSLFGKLRNLFSFIFGKPEAVKKYERELAVYRAQKSAVLEERGIRNLQYDKRLLDPQTRDAYLETGEIVEPTDPHVPMEYLQDTDETITDPNQSRTIAVIKGDDGTNLLEFGTGNPFLNDNTNENTNEDLTDEEQEELEKQRKKEQFFSKMPGMSGNKQQSFGNDEPQYGQQGEQQYIEHNEQPQQNVPQYIEHNEQPQYEQQQNVPQYIEHNEQPQNVPQYIEHNEQPQQYKQPQDPTENRKNMEDKKLNSQISDITLLLDGYKSTASNDESLSMDALVGYLKESKDDPQSQKLIGDLSKIYQYQRSPKTDPEIVSKQNAMIKALIGDINNVRKDAAPYMFDLDFDLGKHMRNGIAKLLQNRAPAGQHYVPQSGTDKTLF